MATTASDLSPVELVQNPALGATILWKFGRGFQEQSVGELPTFELFFLVLPLTLHLRTLEEVRSTQVGSGLGKLVEKLSDDRENLVAVHARVLAMRPLTLESISTAVATKLLTVDHATAKVQAYDVAPPKLPERLKAFLPAADKLGRWFARVPPPQTFSLLQVYP